MASFFHSLPLILFLLHGVVFDKGHCGNQLDDALGVPSFEQGRQHASKADLSRDLDGAFETQRRCHKIPALSVAIYSKSQVFSEDASDLNPMRYANAFGWHDVDSKKKATSDGTLFCLASVSKPLTAILTMYMLRHAQEHGLSYNESTLLREIDPVFGMPESSLKDATISDILSHQTGLQVSGGISLFGAPANSTRKGVAYDSAKAPRLREIGKLHAYDNQVFAIAGYIAEVVAEQITGVPTTWENLMVKHIFEPLGIEHEVEFIDDIKNKTRLATYYMNQAGQIRKFDPEYFKSSHPVGPSGSLCMTMNGAAVLLELLANKGTYQGKHLIDPRDLESTWLPRIAVSTFQQGQVAGASGIWHVRRNYGLGWYDSEYNGRQIVSHSGGFMAITSLLTVDYSKGIVILTTSTGSPTSEDLHYEMHLLIIDSLTGSKVVQEFQQCKPAELSVSLPVLESLSSQQVPVSHSNFTGIYEHPIYGRLSITQHGGRLKLLIGRFGNATIVCKSDQDCFLQHDGLMWWLGDSDFFRNFGLEFQRVKFKKEDGCVTQVVVGMFSEREVPFTRKADCLLETNNFSPKPMVGLLLRAFIGSFVLTTLMEKARID